MRCRQQPSTPVASVAASPAHMDACALGRTQRHRTSADEPSDPAATAHLLQCRHTPPRSRPPPPLLVPLLLLLPLLSAGALHAGGPAPWIHRRSLHEGTSEQLGRGEQPEPEEWKDYMHQLNMVTVNNQRLSNLLGPVLNYRFSMPEVQLRKGSTYTGSNSRLRRAVRDLITGHRPVKIGVVGGSITWGTGPSQRGVTDWFSIFSRYMVQAFPKANVTLRNGCVPGTPSSYMIMCLELSVESDVDVVFSEYVLNDGIDPKDRIYGSGQVKDVERLTRRVLALPSHPALIFMQCVSHGMATEPDVNDHRSFSQTMEDVYGSVAQYYDVPSLSLRTAAYRLAAFKRREGFRWANLMDKDGFHPGDGGHKVMADLAVWMVQQTTIDVLTRPFNKQDAELVSEPLPVPMYEGNAAPETPLCLFQDMMAPLVLESSGWDYINEGTEEKPKKGYITREPGKPLKLKMNTWRGGSCAANPDTSCGIKVFIAHLRSYNDMGVAKVECVEGCQCDPRYIDGWHNLQQSQTFLAALKVTQHEACVLTVTVEPSRAQGEAGNDREGSKFKVSGVMLSESSEEKYDKDIPDGKWGMTGHADDNNEQIVITASGIEKATASSFVNV